MALTKYKAKRNFKESPEPTGGKPSNAKLRFVIQKHDASRLHYDFRLEIDGVLKSWAVPKGPSTDPAIKRLAVMVEDHPFDYRTFEGVIPSGYGAGTVIVWDEGFYEPADHGGKDKKSQNKELSKGISSGKLHIVLHGKKLKGEYALVKTRGREENAWLLFKVKDKYVSKEDITLKDKSVLSNKTLEQIGKTTSDSKKQIKPSSSARKKRTAVKKSVALNTRIGSKRTPSETTVEKKIKREPKNIIIGGKQAKFPEHIAPMLATLVADPFDKEGWQYEVKWDGYRTLAFCDKKNVELRSRNNKSFNEKFFPVHKAMQEWNINAVVDGEVVVLDEKGRSNFGALQNWRSEADGAIYYYVFDLLWYNGKDLMQLPLSERRDILRQIVPENSIIRLSENFPNSGLEFFEAVKGMGLEGIIAKKSDSVYQAGERSRDWLKIKSNKRQEMVIGGYTKNDDSSKAFSSLLLGVYDNGKLIYTGKVGTGFNDKQQKEMLKQFKPLITNKPPFTELPDINKPTRFRPNPPHATAVWLKPELVCEVSFAEMTTDGIMRHPSFEAMRIDKKAKEVVKENAVEIKDVPTLGKTKAKIKLQPRDKMERKSLLNPTDETQVRKINGHDLKFTNLSKVYWPGDGITKRDMLNYYYQVAPYILPYLKDRPQSLNRHPNGITGKSFYQKDVTGKAPDWIKKYKYHSADETRDKHFLVATDEASLLYMASLGCIEMNPWSSKIGKPDNPDWCIIDLDPAKNTFDQVIEAAKVTHQVLDSLGADSYVKTSGSTGIHVYIPLGAKYTYEQSKEFARIVVTLVHQQIPKYTSIERIVKARGGKMYLDFLQNRPQATVAAAYSLRPKPGATVSMPLHWDEVKKGLKMSSFTIHNAIDRVKQEGDIFKPVLGKGVSLSKIIKTFNSRNI